MISISVAEVSRLFADLRWRIEDISPVTPVIAVIIQKSIQQNIRSGGRTDGSNSGRIDSGGSNTWQPL